MVRAQGHGGHGGAHKHHRPSHHGHDHAHGDAISHGQHHGTLGALHHEMEAGHHSKKHSEAQGHDGHGSGHDSPDETSGTFSTPSGHGDKGKAHEATPKKTPVANHRPSRGIDQVSSQEMPTTLTGAKAREDSRSSLPSSSRDDTQQSPEATGAGTVAQGSLLEVGVDAPGSTSPRSNRKHFMDKLKKHTAIANHNPLYGDGKIAARICLHPLFEPICLSVICMNSLWLGYSVDQEDPDGKDPPMAFNMLDNFFCLYFSFEIVLRVAAYRSPLAFFFDPLHRAWNVFDLTLVIFLIIETWLLALLAKGGETPDLPALSALRLLRMLRIVRVLKMFPELAMMVRSLMAAIRSTSTTVILAVGIMYIFSIIFCQWAKTHVQKHSCKIPSNCIDEAFGSIPKAMLTLMQILCFDAAFSLIRAVLDENYLYGLLLIVFILIAAFTVMNMLIGVVCQIVAQTSSMERTSQMKAQVSALVRMLEIEDTGFISRKELERNKQVLSELDKVGVDDELLKTALNIIDRKSAAIGDPTHLDVDELLEVIFKLRNKPETQDIILIQKKLQKLETALATSVKDNKSEAKTNETLKAMDDEEDISLEMDESTRMAVEKNLWELEAQVTSMLEQAMDATGRALKPPTAPGWDVELRRLDGAMCRLRVRLERCQNEKGPLSSIGGGAAADEAVNLAEAELQYWRKLCGEVVQSISAASTLMAQAVREAEPDGQFRGTADDLFRAAANLRTQTI